MTETKICQCGDPQIPASLPEGFSGKVICGRCKGVMQYPLGKAEAGEEGKAKEQDTVKDFLARLYQTSPKLTMEKAVLIMLVSIEEKLGLLVDALADSGPKKGKKADKE